MRGADMARLAEVAGTQDGVFHIDQALALGIDRQVIRRCGSMHVLERLHPNVWRFPSAAPTERQRVRAALLQVGGDAVASHESALCLGGAGHVPFELAVTVGPTENHQHRGIRVHRLGDLTLDMITTIDGLRTTTLARAVVDVSSRFRRDRLQDLVDRLTITERSTSLGAIDRALRRSNHRGRRNIGTLQALLDARHEEVPRSIAERDADELLAGTALPAAVHEYPHPGWELGPAFVDRAWPEAMLILEVDGRSWHARERDMTKDRARDRAAGVAGWYTARVMHREIVDEPTAVIDDLVGLYHARRRQLGR